MPIIRIENVRDLSPEEFKKMLQEAWEDSSPVDDLVELAQQLAFMENKYGMKSADFYEKYNKGEMGDDVDFVWWASLYDLFTDLRGQIERVLMKASVRDAETQEVAEKAEEAPVT